MAIGAGAALPAFVIASFVPRHRPATGPAHPAPTPGVRSEATAAVR